MEVVHPQEAAIENNNIILGWCYDSTNFCELSREIGNMVPWASHLWKNWTHHSEHYFPMDVIPHAPSKKQNHHEYLRRVECWECSVGSQSTQAKQNNVLVSWYTKSYFKCLKKFANCNVFSTRYFINLRWYFFHVSIVTNGHCL